MGKLHVKGWGESEAACKKCGTLAGKKCTQLGPLCTTLDVPNRFPDGYGSSLKDMI